MAILEVVIPQLGEGLREVLLQKLLKKPGERVERDEPIYIVETDKAVLEVESPYAGTLKEWVGKEGKVLPVGAVIARIDGAMTPLNASAAGAVSAAGAAIPLERVSTAIGAEKPTATEATVRPARAGAFVPPRTHAYCRKWAIAEDEIERIPAATGTLMPADVDRYLAARSSQSAAEEAPAKAGPPAAHQDFPLSARQRVFNFRLKRSAQLVVPATMTRELEWLRLETAVKSLGRQVPKLHSSDFETVAYALALATRDNPVFRSVLVGDDTIRQFDYLNLGIAVQQPRGELLMAIVPKADLLDFPSFIKTLREQVRLALEGEDQVNDEVPLYFNYVGNLEVTSGIPVLVAPAIAVVYLGAPIGRDQNKTVNLGVTFDHRLINGVKAAGFLADIVRRLESFSPTDVEPRHESRE